MRAHVFRSVLLLAITALGAFSQPLSSRVNLEYTEGNVGIDGKTPRLDSFLPAGSLLKTSDGRAQVRFGSGDQLFLGQKSSVQVGNDASILRMKSTFCKGPRSSLLARSSTSNRRVLAARTFIDVQSKYKYCGSTAESNLDTALAFSLRKRENFPL